MNQLTGDDPTHTSSSSCVNSKGQRCPRGPLQHRHISCAAFVTAHTVVTTVVPLRQAGVSAAHSGQAAAPRHHHAGMLPLLLLFLAPPGINRSPWGAALLNAWPRAKPQFCVTHLLPRHMFRSRELKMSLFRVKRSLSKPFLIFLLHSRLRRRPRRAEWRGGRRAGGAAGRRPTSGVRPGRGGASAPSVAGVGPP